MAKTKRRQSQSISRKKAYTLKSQYQSNNGMLTTIWGPAIWHFLHTMSFNYPVKPTCEDKQHYRDFVLSLKHVLPCGKCRKNLINNLKKHPLELSHMKSRDTFSKWVYTFHEAINTMLKKKSGLTYAEVRERYENSRARCTTPLDPQPVIDEKKDKEMGCVEPIYGVKSKCVIHIVPQEKKCKTLHIDNRCLAGTKSKQPE